MLSGIFVNKRKNSLKLKTNYFFDFNTIKLTLTSLKTTHFCFLCEFIKIYEVARLLMANNSCYFYFSAALWDNLLFLGTDRKREEKQQWVSAPQVSPSCHLTQWEILLLNLWKLLPASGYTWFTLVGVRLFSGVVVPSSAWRGAFKSNLWGLPLRVF